MEALPSRRHSPVSIPARHLKDTATTTFVQGSNALVVPRGLFYESQLNRTLIGPNATATTPLGRMTVQANQFAISGTFTLDAYLNARPVQMVFSGNVTLEEAQWFADQLRLTARGKTTSFLLDVSNEFYTMGFVGAVIRLLLVLNLVSLPLGIAGVVMAIAVIGLSPDHESWTAIFMESNPGQAC